MTAEAYKRLRNKGGEIEMDGKVYRVIGSDSLGRLQLRKLAYYIDCFDYMDEDYDTYDEANDAIQTIMQDNDTPEEDIEDLEDAEIGERLDPISSPFWMHYKDIEADDITYKL